MSHSPHRLFLASAGTGKTYQLTNHYLGLLLRGVPAERVLATTFTRKAAGEILDRVLDRLARAAEGGKGLEDLRRALADSGAEERPGGEALHLAALDAERCRDLLVRLVRGLDRFQVRTIDAFFVQVAGLFALDLALPPGWRIGEEREDTALRADALQRVLADAEPDEIALILRGLLAGGDGRAVQQTALRQIDAARNAWLESRPEAWEWLEVPLRLGAEEVNALVRELELLELPLTKAGKVSKNWQKAVDQLKELALAGDWESIPGKGLPKAVAVGNLTYYKDPISEEVEAVVARLLAEAGACFAEQVAERNLALRGLLERFEVPYAEAKASTGRFRFDDLPQLIAGRPGEEDDGDGWGGPLRERELDPWFRLDGRLDHLLLDEFQDTAPVQWRILENIANEILAVGDGERTFFCVGDVKQSIYGWREAEPRLLKQLAEHYSAADLVAEPLDESWRSSRVVLDTVNRVFGTLGSSAALAGEESFAEAGASGRWSETFHDHVAARDLPGAAALWVIPEADGAPDRNAKLRAATVERVVALRVEAPNASVGVLFRSNKGIAGLIHALRLAGVPAAGEGGNPLTDSAAVVAFLALLHLADQPEDGAAAFHVGATPFGEELGIGARSTAEERSALSRDIRRRLAYEGYGALAAQLAAVVAASDDWTSWDRLRFGQLVDLAHAYEIGATLRASDFVDEVRTKKVEAPGTGVVRVMTIHASKGLEFDAVVLPELEGDLRGTASTLWKRRTSPYAAIDAVSTTLRKDRLAAVPDLAELAAHVVGRNVEESLCVLYVAMTRAARRLDLIVSAPPAKQGVPTFADVLRTALVTAPDPDAGSDVFPEEPEVDTEGAAAPRACTRLWVHPDSVDDWAAGCGVAEESDAAEPCPDHETRDETRDDEALATSLSLTAPERVLRARRPSQGGVPKAADLLRSHAAARRGTLVHAWLEQLDWVEDFDPDGPHAAALGERLEPDPARRSEARAALAAALGRPAVREALSKAAAGGGELEVRAEHEFSQLRLGPDGGTGGEEEEWNGSIDRLVLAREGDRVVRADVLDYKTDQVTPETLADAVEHHRPQLAAYRDAVSAQYGLDPGDVRARLVFLESGDVVDV